MRARHLLTTARGFTLPELVTVMGLFVIILMISAEAFEKIMTTSSQQTTAAESQIEGIVGLELFRADLQQAGFGLPWVYQSPITFPECTEPPLNGADPTSLNDGGATSPARPPRAVIGINGDDPARPTGFNNSDYLAVKATVAGMNPVARKWTYLTYTGATTPGSRVKSWRGAAASNLQAGDRVIVVRTGVVNGILRKTLVVEGGAYFTTARVTGSVLTFEGFTPPGPLETYLVYGVDSGDLAGMPFNRADYYLDTPRKQNDTCAPGTGTLYKGVVDQDGGRVAPHALLDCVADLQVVYSLDTNGDGTVDLHDNAGLTALGTPPTAEAIRRSVKEVRVYILSHEGKRDRGFTYPSATGLIPVGETLNGVFYGKQAFDLAAVAGPGWQHYRWKVYPIVAKPMNLD